MPYRHLIDGLFIGSKITGIFSTFAANPYIYFVLEG